MNRAFPARNLAVDASSYNRKNVPMQLSPRAIFRRIGLIVALSALLLFVLAPLQVSRAAGSEERVLHMAVIGDSYTAGNGTNGSSSETVSSLTSQYIGLDRSYYGDYYGQYMENGKSVNPYRSKLNYGNHYARWLRDQGVNVDYNNYAHSGATLVGEAQHGIINQVDNLPENTDLVLFTAGGNDVKFSTIIKNCFTYMIRDPQKCAGSLSNAFTLLDTVASNTRTLFEKLERRIAQGKTAQAVLIAYPLLSLAPDDPANTDPNYYIPYNSNFHPVPIVRELGLEAVKRQAEVVRQWNSEPHTLKVTYIGDTVDRFKGKEPNPDLGGLSWDSGRNLLRWINEFRETMGVPNYSPTAKPYGKIYSEGTTDTNNWYHPNIQGHYEISRMIEEKLGIPELSRPVSKETPYVDIALVLDATGSMWDDIEAVRENIHAIVARVKEQTASARFAIVTYQDHPGNGGIATDYPSKLETDFTEDVNQLDQALTNIALGNGGDQREAVYSGLKTALDLNWRAGVKKLAIVYGDAKPKDPEPVSHLTGTELAQLAKSKGDDSSGGGVQISAIDSGKLTKEAKLKALIDATGGVAMPIGEASQSVDAITGIVTDFAQSPVANFDGPFNAAPGSTLTFDARGSYSPEGTITKYEWDFNGDGIYEVSTSKPQIRHLYAKPFDGLASLRVTDVTGKQHVDAKTVTITNDPDKDGIPSASDNCAQIYNPGQEDANGDGTGDACQEALGLDTVRTDATEEEGTAPAQPTQPEAPSEGAADVSAPANTTGTPETSSSATETAQASDTQHATTDAATSAAQGSATAAQGSATDGQGNTTGATKKVVGISSFFLSTFAIVIRIVRVFRRRFRW